MDPPRPTDLVSRRATSRLRATGPALPRVLARPLLPLACGVGIGSWIGSWIGSYAGSTLAPELATAAAFAVALGLVSTRRWGTERSRPWRAGALVLLLALVRAAASTAPATPPPPDRTVEGVWQPARGSRGTLRTDSDVRARARWALDVVGPAPAPGETVRLLGSDEHIRPARGPGSAFGLGAWSPDGWARVQPDQLRRLGPAPAPGWFDELRARLAHRARARVPNEHAGLYGALLVGERAGLDASSTDLFTRTGVRHLLAVSGLHVALVAALLFAPLARGCARLVTRVTAASWDTRRCELAVQSLLVLLFVPIAGAAPPVARAGLALALAGIAPWVGPRAPGHGERGLAGPGRRPDALSLWSAALLLEGVLDPHAGSRLGVQLSYLATLGLIVGSSAFGGGSTPARARRWGPARAGFLAAVHVRASRATRAAVGASIVATIATLPVIWSGFGEFGPWGVVLTPLALPLVAALLALGWISTLGPVALPASLLAAPADLLLELLSIVDHAPATPFVLPERPALLVAALCATTMFWLHRPADRRESPGRRAGRGPRLARVLAVGWALLLLPWAASPAHFELHALDVGHGTCVAARAPGQRAWVFDAGSRDRPYAVRESLGPLLRAWETRRVQLVVSHDHRDHTSGLRWLLERHPPTLVAGALPAQLAERLPHDAVRLDTPAGTLTVSKAARHRAGGFRAELVRGGQLAGNEGSRSLRLLWRGQGLLLTGDAEDAGLGPLLDAGAARGRPLRLLLAPHHGVRTGRVGELLDAQRPREVWVSGSRPPAIGPELDRRGLPWSWTGNGPLALRLPWDPGEDIAREKRNQHSVRY